MTIAMERILAWKLLPRVVMAVMLWQYVVVLGWFMSLPPRHRKHPSNGLNCNCHGGH